MEFGKYLSQDFVITGSSSETGKAEGERNTISVNLENKHTKECLENIQVFSDNSRKYIHLPDQCGYDKSSYLKNAARGDWYENKGHAIRYYDNEDFFINELIEKLQGEYEILDFTNCFFEIVMDLRNLNIDKEIDFSGSVFKGFVDFSDNEFNKSVKLSNVIIHQDLQMKNTDFKDEFYLTESEINGSVDALGVKFKKLSAFNYTKFKGSVVFNSAFFHRSEFKECVIKGEANFEKTFFYRSADFDFCKFAEEATFRRGIFESTVDFFSCIFEKNFDLSFTKIVKLNLKDIFFKGNFYFTSINITEAINRETYRILKHEYLKIDDNIEAFNFHVLEMDKHLEELSETNTRLKYEKYTNNKTKTSDELILYFEKYVSYFGSNPLLPAIWFLIVHYIATFSPKKYSNVLLEQLPFTIFVCTTLLILLFDQIFPKRKKIEEILNDRFLQLSILFILIFGMFLFVDVLKSILDVIKFKDYSNKENWILFIYIFKSIISYALIYEIIKSFRKYSRKL